MPWFPIQKNKEKIVCIGLSSSTNKGWMPAAVSLEWIDYVKKTFSWQQSVWLDLKDKLGIKVHRFSGSHL